jgi:hypothetical protein
MTHSRWVVGNDHASSNEHFENLKTNLAGLSDYLKRGMQP